LLTAAHNNSASKKRQPSSNAEENEDSGIISPGENLSLSPFSLLSIHYFAEGSDLHALFSLENDTVFCKSPKVSAALDRMKKEGEFE
jgi:hypothetical protein